MANLIGFRILPCAVIAVVWALSAQTGLAEPLRIVSSISPGAFNYKAHTQLPDLPDEVTRQVLIGMGREVSFEFLPGRRAWTMIVRGEADGMSAVLRTSERERICAFPDEPVLRDRSVLFIRAADVGKLKFSSLNDLAGHQVSAPRSYLADSSAHPNSSPEMVTFLRDHHSLVETNGNDEGLRMLVAGRVDYTIMDLGLAKSEIPALGLSGKIEPLLSRSVADHEVSVCFTRARVSPAFVDAFSRALKKFKQTATFRAIEHKYGL